MRPALDTECRGQAARRFARGGCGAGDGQAGPVDQRLSASHHRHSPFSFSNSSRTDAPNNEAGTDGHTSLTTTSRCQHTWHRMHHISQCSRTRLPEGRSLLRDDEHQLLHGLELALGHQAYAPQLLLTLRVLLGQDVRLASGVAQQFPRGGGLEALGDCA